MYKTFGKNVTFKELLILYCYIFLFCKSLVYTVKTFYLFPSSIFQHICFLRALKMQIEFYDIIFRFSVTCAALKNRNLVLFKDFVLMLMKDILHKKSSFPLRISSVNVTKSAGNCGFGHIY